jgi:hypothetical protein
MNLIFGDETAEKENKYTETFQVKNEFLMAILANLKI